MKKYVSIDIGGTAIKYGIIGESGEILVKQEMATEAQKGGPSILQKALDIVEGFQREYELEGVCISTAGMVDVEEGMIFYAGPLMPDYTGTKFKKTIEEKTGLPCEVENDVNCAGLAESVSGAAKGSRVTLCLTIGTGIGGCILIDGEVFHGYSGSACEVGHMLMDGDEFQAFGATSVLCTKVAEMKRQPVQDWDGRRIFAEAQNGDAACIQAIDEMADTLGKGIANTCYVVNPQTVVLGGGIMAQEAYLKPRIQSAIEKYLMTDVAKHTELKMAEHKNDAGMLGAFYHFRGRRQIQNAR